MEEEEQANKPKNGKKKEAKIEPESTEKKEFDENKDRLLRLTAEFDNYKKRTAKDLENAKNIGRADVIIKLLPTLDEFEIALDSMDRNSEIAKGVALIFSNFIGALKGLGLNEIDANGKFDPYKHEIMLAKESERPEGTIIEVIRKGYTFNDILLRPTSVMVSKHKVNDNKEE